MSAENELDTPPKRRGRPAKVAEAPPAVDMEALRAEMEAKVRAEIEEKLAKEAAEAELVRAAAAEAKPLSAADVDGDPDVPESITVHFVEDGLTLLGKVWYRGEELTVNPSTPQWDEAAAVLQLDEYEQERRWGRRMYRAGVWRGKPITDAVDPDMPEAERMALARAQSARDARYGSR